MCFPSATIESIFRDRACDECRVRADVCVWDLHACANENALYFHRLPNACANDGRLRDYACVRVRFQNECACANVSRRITEKRPQ